MEHLETISGPNVVQSGTLTSGSPVITGLTTSALAGAVRVSGAGVPLGTLVQSIDSTSQLTLTADATTSGAASLTFGLEPVTLAEAKLHMRVDYPEDDSLIASLITAARLRAEVLLRQTLLLTTYDLYLDAFPCGGGGYYYRTIRQMGPGPGWLPTGGGGIIPLAMGPVNSVTSVKYVDISGTLQTLSAATYTVSIGPRARVQSLPGSAFPIPRDTLDAVVIRYTAGAATAAAIPETVKAAMKLMVGHWYEHREEVSDTQIWSVPNAVDALLSASDPGIYS